MEHIKENWDDDLTDRYGPKTDTAVEKAVLSRLSDGWLYSDYWNDFKIELTFLMKQRNPSLVWESPDFHSYEDDYHQEDQKFNSLTGEELLHSLINFDRHQNVSLIKIHAYGNDGLCIDPEWEREKCILAACKTGFYRDWEHNGICVRTEEAEEWP